MKYFFSFLTLILFTKVAAASTYFLSASGNDNMDGLSVATAWKTITKLNSIKLLPGDVVKFEGGTTFSGTVYLAAEDRGTPAQPIVITSYGAGRAIVSAGTNAGLYAYNTAGIDVININFTGGAGSTTGGVYFNIDSATTMLQHVKIEDVDVSGFYDYGILISSKILKGFDDVLINRVMSHDNGHGGIQTNANDQAVFVHKNIRVTNSKAYNNKGILNWTNHSGNGIMISEADSALVDNCEAYNNGENSTFVAGGPVGIWLAYIKNGIIQNSESHHNKTQALDGGGFDLDGGCQNCVIQYCYSHDNFGAGFLLAEWGSGVLFANNKLRYNVSQNDGTNQSYAGNGGIYIWATGYGQNVTNTEIYNNTVYVFPGRSGIVIVDTNFVNVKISNNIIYSPAGSRLIQANVPVDSTKVHLLQNNYYATSTPVFSWGIDNVNSLAAWKALAVTQERKGNINYGMTKDPLFNAPGTGREGYRLNSNSPMVDSGRNLIDIGSKDFYGGPSKSGSAQDIGAYEKPFVATDNTAPTIPLNVKALYSGRTFVHLDWDNSTDSVGVTGYDVYVGAKKYSVTESALTIDSLLPATAYNFTVKARDLAGNFSASSAVATATTTTLTSGLNYRYYEGGWNALPNFNALSPVKTGSSPNIDLGIKNKSDSFGVVWEGNINITTAGNYLFELVSDEGSKFYFNSFYGPGATATISNDSLHTARTVSANVNIPAVGLYPVALSYFEKSGSESLQLFYSGPGVVRQPVPNTAFASTVPPPATDTTAPTIPLNVKALYSGRTFVHLDWDNSTDSVGVTGYDVYVGAKKYSVTESALTIDSLLPATAYNFTVKARDLAGNFSASSAVATATTTTLASGLNYRYYEGGWNALPNFNALSPVKTGSSPNIDLGIKNKSDSFGVVWEGNINITTAGNYLFELVSDEGSKFYFNSFYGPGATATISNDSLHTARTVSANVNIPAVGLYPVALSYFEKSGTESLQLFYSGPGVIRQPVPNTAFASTVPPPATDTTAPTIPLNVKAPYSGRTFVHLDWDNSTDSVGVTGYDVYVGAKKYSVTESALTIDSLLPATAYNFTVKARDLAGNFSASSAVATATTTTLASGLNYRYYEGGWNALPNFNALSPVKTGSSPNIDLGIKNKSDSFGVVWEGNINITTAGNYLFELVSDEGSKFYFNSFYSPGAIATISNDSLHTARTVSANVNIPAVGLYPVALSYFEKSGSESLQLYYSGPGVTRQLVPNVAFASTVVPPPDTAAPSIPINLKVTNAGPSSISLDWDDATDNVGVTGYDIFVGGVKKYTSTTSQVVVDTLSSGTTYSFTVKARDLAGNISASSAAIPGTTTSVIVANGLNYRYYEGNWDVLPNFSILTPVKTGNTPNVDISVRRSGVNDYFGFVWDGYINITTPGTYTFETVSDDGSRFYFNTMYSSTAVPLVNNDGVHGPWSPVSATVSIPAAGLYPISVTFFEKNSGESMQLYWTGPGISRQLIPNSAFVSNTAPQTDNISPTVPANLKVVSGSRNLIYLDWDDASDNVGVTAYDIYIGGVKKYSSTISQVIADTLGANSSYDFTVKARDLAGNSSAASATVTGTTTNVAASGFNYRYYEGDWNTLPNFSTLTPVKTGVSANVDINLRTPGVNDYFGFVWDGFINITTPGTYTFETASDDGSRFYFNSFYSPTGVALIDNDGVHGPWTPVTATINIPAAGIYPISVTFFEKNSGESMQLYWTGPGISRQLIPNSAFIINSTPQSDNNAPTVPANLKMVSASRNLIYLDWDDATDNVGVVSYDIYIGGIKKYTSSISQVIADTLDASTSYSFTVKARDLAGNVSAASAALVAATTNIPTSGLTYRYYEGNWNTLPNFNTLTPVKTGVTPNVDISIRPPGVNDYFGFVWEGYINITTPGTYTFETVSDDGSRFYFNSFYSPTGAALIDNNGVHGPWTPVIATVSIPAAGIYPVSVTYFEKNSGESMQLYWTGPGISRQLVPNSAFAINTAPSVDNTAPTVPANLKVVSTSRNLVYLDWDDATDNIGVTAYDIYIGGIKKYTSTASQFIADTLTASTQYRFTVKARDLAGNTSALSAEVIGTTTTVAASGLNYRYYEGNWDLLPNFSPLTVVKAGVTPNIDLSVRRAGVNDYFGFVWEGYINITTPGTYTFETVSDDGSRFYFNSFYSPTAVPLIDNDGVHGPWSPIAGTVSIPAAGLYPVAITFFEKNSGESMQLYWSGPGITRQLIPNSAFAGSGQASAQQTIISLENAAQPKNAAAENDIHPELVRAYPNPFDENLSIEFYHNAVDKNVSISLYNLSGRLLLTQKLGDLRGGRNVIKLNSGQLPPGVYIAIINVNGKSSQKLKVVKSRRSMR